MSKTAEKIKVIDSGTNYDCYEENCHELLSNSLVSARKHREATGHVIYITAWFNKIIATDEEIAGMQDA